MNTTPKPFRKERLASIVKEELSNLILRDMEFRNALVTILSAEVSAGKPETVQIHISVIPYDKGPYVYDKLNRARGRLQFKLIRRMGVRVLPRLQFVIDEPGKES